MTKIRCLFLFFPVLLNSLSSLGQASSDTSITVYFPSASWRLDSVQIAALMGFVTSVGNIKSITGHTDTVGSIQSNTILSQKRVESVSGILAAKEPSTFHFLGEGPPQQPILALNRSVVVIAQRRNVISKFVSYKVVDSFDIEVISFVANEAIITPESQSAIPLLLRKLLSYKKSRFRIIGHVNYDGRRHIKPSHPLYKLSEDRAKLIFDLLIENGFPAEKLEHSGVGNSQPLIATPANDDERRKNMRVQIIVESPSS